mmetsp:Transcript_20741/g.36918  ORF Transcript_20741/g.36918 Transcript_20741/m.36918 type:complete len:295 (+) Transcript_20741:310-1194(+)|eukprot:CAMPEP_0197535142 /NCGR_PEP_ID=MMETSP1318-20131121/49556_1 /TAXON_ID=552666 /ORGANISM="Partenskyella glossopodia, Strain RCC365" /LENGTH=294 /DNA_ID=CAMNT_0043092643 /DNA_START=295 /DNA_END=1179 /DNA_ORIENTATION=-
MSDVELKPTVVKESKSKSSVRDNISRAATATAKATCCLCDFLYSIPYMGIIGLLMMSVGIGLISEALRRLNGFLHDKFDIEINGAALLALKILHGITMTIAFLNVIYGALHIKVIFYSLYHTAKCVCPACIFDSFRCFWRFLGNSALCVAGFFAAIPCIVFVLALMAATVVQTINAQIRLLCKASEDVTQAIIIIIQKNDQIYSNTKQITPEQIENFCDDDPLLSKMRDWGKNLLVGAILCAFGSIVVAVSYTLYTTKPLPKIKEEGEEVPDDETAPAEKKIAFKNVDGGANGV